MINNKKTTRPFKKRDDPIEPPRLLKVLKFCKGKQNAEPLLVVIPIRSASTTYFLKNG